MSSVFRWSGEYVGFIDGPFLFGLDGRYLGWHETDGSVWRADGRPFGVLVDGAYVLRDLRRSPAVRRTPRVPPLPATPPPAPGSQLARLPRPGWVDALEDVGRPPTPTRLRGIWCDRDSRLELHPGGDFRWVGTDGSRSAGRWRIEGRMLHLDVEEGDSAPAEIAFAVIDLEGDLLTLRRSAFESRSLLFTLRRVEPASPSA